MWGWEWGGALERDIDPLSTLYPLCPPTSHLPCEHCAHRREEPLWGVAAKDGHAVGPLQPELQAKGRQARSAGRKGPFILTKSLFQTARDPASPPQGPPSQVPCQRVPWRTGHSAALAAPPRPFPGSPSLGPGHQASQPILNGMTSKKLVSSLARGPANANP